MFYAILPGIVNLGISSVIFHWSWWVLGLLLVLGILAGARRFAPEILTQLWDQLKSLAKLVIHLLSEIRKFFFQFAGILWSIWGLLFALRWRAQFAIRYAFVSTTLGVLFLGTFFLCAELVLTLLNGLKSELPEFYTRLSELLSSNLPAVHAWLSKLRMPQVHEIPFKLELGLFVLALLMFRHHWHEFKASFRREAVPPALEELFLEFDKFRKANPAPDRQVKDAFLEKLMKKMKGVLDTKSNRDVAFSLMEEEELDDGHKKTKTGILTVTFLPDKSLLDKGLKLPIGEGGAGKAYHQKVAIYIPSVRHRIAIDLDHEISVGVTYKESADKKKFRSILSVPVLVNSTKDAIAVIVVYSKKRNAFQDADFAIVRLTASIVSTLY